MCVSIQTSCIDGSYYYRAQGKNKRSLKLLRATIKRYIVIRVCAIENLSHSNHYIFCPPTHGSTDFCQHSCQYHELRTILESNTLLPAMMYHLNLIVIFVRHSEHCQPN